MPSVNPDIYNIERKYEVSVRRIENDPTIVDVNKKYILRYLDLLETTGLSIPRLDKYATTFITIGRLARKDFNLMTRDDVQDLLIAIKRKKKGNTWRIKGEHYSEFTINDFKMMIRKFWRWLKNWPDPKTYPSEVSWIERSKVPTTTITRADLITEEDRIDLVSVAGDTQEIALVDVFLDGGGRAGEILTQRLRDVEVKPYGFKLNVWKSKTYARPISLVKSAPSLASWLAIHPYRENPDAPLWLNKHGQQLMYGQARKKIRKLVERVERTRGRKIWKRIYLHLFRHTSATEFIVKGKGSMPIMNKRFGWSPESSMAAVYGHLVDEDVEDAIVRADCGQQVVAQIEKEKGQIDETKPVQCVRCGNVNAPASKYCSRCAFPLTNAAATEAIENDEKAVKAEALLNEVMKDERVKNIMLEVMKDVTMKKVLNRQSLLP